MNEIIIAGRSPAVQYLRMSTDHQRYSIDNQKAAIAAFAAARGYDIIGTYEDAGKSGLTLRERDGLNRLLHDVTSPTRTFSTILVLDISRWGRFQDPDQHGAYEFLCREMGVNVEYVSEAFKNDGSPGSTLMKNLKRVMAGEYSRELSVKITQAQHAAARRGFKLGGPPVYGFRRMVIDKDGRTQGVLEAGEHKYLRSDRVVLVHGPPEEVRVIRRIFHMFVDQRISIDRIADLLNGEGIPAQAGRWNRPRVRSILGSELVIGNYVYGKSQCRLKGASRRNPEATWIRVPMLKPLISSAKFRQAAALLKSPSYPFSRVKMISGLKRLLKEKGELTTTLINGCAYLPDCRTIRKQLGPMAEVCRLVGYDHKLKQPLPPRERRHYTRDEGLEALRRTYAAHGHISIHLLAADPEAPSSTWYYRTFGSMMTAYKEAGFTFTAQEQRVKGYRRQRRRFLNGGMAPCPPPTPYVESVSDEVLFAGIRRLFKTHGYISGRLIQDDPELPSINFIYKRFASTLHAYQMAGLNFTASELRLLARRVRRGEVEHKPEGKRPFNLSRQLLARLEAKSASRKGG